MTKKLDKKTTKTLALLATSKANPVDTISSITHKVVNDYLEAKKIVVADFKAVMRLNKKQAKASRGKKGRKQAKAAKRTPTKMVALTDQE